MDRLSTALAQKLSSWIMVCDSGSVLKNDGMATGAQVDNSRLDSSPGEKLGLFILLAKRLHQRPGYFLEPDTELDAEAIADAWREKARQTK